MSNKDANDATSKADSSLSRSASTRASKMVAAVLYQDNDQGDLNYFHSLRGMTDPPVELGELQKTERVNMFLSDRFVLPSLTVTADLGAATSDFGDIMAAAESRPASTISAISSRACSACPAAPSRCLPIAHSISMRSFRSCAWHRIPTAGWDGSSARITARPSPRRIRSSRATSGRCSACPDELFLPGRRRRHRDARGEVRGNRDRSLRRSLLQGDRAAR